jgi:glycosyltransferase involved in cell wall biosynthesis
MSPLRVLLVSAEYPPQPGGIGDYTRCLASALERAGCTVDVLTARAGRATVLRPGAEGAPATVGGRLGWGWETLAVVGQAVRRLRPQVVHVQYQTGAYAMRPAIMLLPALMRLLPQRPGLVVTMHDLLLPYLFPKAGRLREWLTLRLMADSDRVVVTNRDDYARLLGQAGTAAPAGPIYRGPALPAGHAPALIPIGSNIAVAPPPGFERERWRAQLGLADDATLVCYFGLVSPSKGLDTLLDALDLLPDTLRLIVIGGQVGAAHDQAYAEALHERMRIDLRGRATITGHCTPEEVSAYLLASDLCALPFRDGASFRRGSLLAALAHGVATVTTRAPGGQQAEATTLLEDEQAALLTAPGDAAALADAIGRLSRDAPLRAALGASGRTVAQRFDWTVIAARHVELYRALTEGKRSDTI